MAAIKRLSGRPGVIDLACMLLAATLALLAAAWVVHLWNMHLHIPFERYTADGMDSLVAVKTIIGGHAFTNDQIGAPFGTRFEDFPHYWDPVIVALIWLLGLFTNDAVTVFNVIYVLGFPIVACSTYLALRWIGTRRNLSVFGAVLFALLPYHFLRGQAHLILGIYWAVPLGGALAYELLRGVPLFTSRAGAYGWRQWLTKRSVASALILLACGLTFSYYAVFTLCMVAFVAIFRVLTTRSFRAALPAIGALVVVGFMTVLTTAPTIKYRHDHGKNQVVAKRLPYDSERYALRLTQTLFPINGHRIKPLASFTGKYLSTAPVLGEGTSEVALGALLSLSILIAVGWLFVSGLGGRAPPAELTGTREAGALALLMFLMATVGGGASILAYVVSPQIRSWNRGSTFIAFFALIVLLGLLRWLGGKVSEKRLRRLSPAVQALVAAVALCAIGGLSILDTTSPSYAHAKNNDTVTAWRNDARFVANIQRSVPPGSMILQVPYSEFPESPDNNGIANDYDLFRGYVHSDTLRWTYGAMKGRATDWGAKTLARQSLETIVPVAAVAGFAGVYMDREFYDDNGDAAAAQLHALLGAPSFVSDNQRLLYFPMAGLKAAEDKTCSDSERRAARTALFYPTASGKGLELTCAKR